MVVCDLLTKENYVIHIIAINFLIQKNHNLIDAQEKNFFELVSKC